MSDGGSGGGTAPVRSPLDRWGRTALLLGTAYAFLVVCLQTPVLETPVASPLLFVSVLLTFSIAYRWDLHRDRGFLVVWAGFSIALAVASVLTGYLNGLTDEGFTTPLFVELFPNLYGSSLMTHGTSYGYVYLPLLPWIQVPYVDYRWVTVGCWALVLYLTRANRVATVLLGAPWIGILAACGFNDFVPLLFLTLTFVTFAFRRWGRLTEVIALGLKQFANIVIIVYFLFRRQWWELAFAIAVTALLLLPFALLDPGGVWCHVFLLNTNAGCEGGFAASSVLVLVSHLNYWVWPVFVLAIFAPRYARLVAGPRYDRDRARVARWLGRATFYVPHIAWSYALIPLSRVVGWFRRPPPSPPAS